jgi:hypothetical protein
MLLFAHLGLTLAAAKLVERFGLRPDLPIVLLGSILPDLIDKPLGYLIYGSMATGRIFAHTLLFLLVLVALAAILKSRPLGSLAFGVLAHQALDTIWRTPEVFLWPILGDFPVKAHVSVLGYFEMLIHGLQNPAILVPELLGLFFLLYFAIHHPPGAFTKEGKQTWPSKLKVPAALSRSYMTIPSPRSPQDRPTGREGGAEKANKRATPADGRAKGPLNRAPPKVR